MRRTLLTVALSILIAVPAAAQQPLKLSFQNGRVSVDATSVPVRTILNEWAKLGGTKVVGAERITGAPLTVKLVDVPESQALEIILRSVAGYMAAPRNGSSSGPSTYDRILVMATTSAPPPTAARPTPAANNNAFNGTQRFVPQRPNPQQQQEQQEQDEPDQNPPNPPVFTFPQGGQQNGFQQPQPFVNAPGNVVQPQINVAPGSYPAPISINPAPAPGQTMPFGASTPGMIVQPPQPTQPGSVRPPGQK
ncbi:MAG: hypothetical protein ABI983_01045 [Acidobacteriota bacterium]